MQSDANWLVLNLTLCLPCSVITFDYIVSIKHNLFWTKIVFRKNSIQFWACWQTNLKMVQKRRENSGNFQKMKKKVMFCLECGRNLNWFQGQPASQLESWKFFTQIRHIQQYLIVSFADFFCKITTVLYFFKVTKFWQNIAANWTKKLQILYHYRIYFFLNHVMMIIIMYSVN